VIITTISSQSGSRPCYHRLLPGMEDRQRRSESGLAPIESERYSPRREHAHSSQPQICEPTADYFKYQKRDTTGTEEEDDGRKHKVAGTAIL
jgi:hypothetical protein